MNDKYVKTYCILLRSYSKMGKLCYPGLEVCVNLILDKGLLHFILFFFLGPTTHEGVMPTTHEGVIMPTTHEGVMPTIHEGTMRAC